jgi:hypothetical protein
MGLLDDLKSGHAQPSQAMRFDIILAALSDEERGAVLEVIGKLRDNLRQRGTHPQYSMRWLADLLTSYGHQISPESIKRWIDSNG